MKLKTILLSVLGICLYTMPMYADCQFVPTEVTVEYVKQPIQGINVTWKPHEPTLGITKYLVVLEMTTTKPHSFDTIPAGVNPVLFIPYTQLCNGEYKVSVIAICPDGTKGQPSDPIDVSIASNLACYLGNIICPGVDFNTQDRDFIDGSKKIIIPCDQETYTLKPKIRIAGGTISGYKVEQIPYSPPYSLEEGEPVALTDDDKYCGVTQLPFKFCFYENTYEELLMAPNGYLSFNVENANKSCGWSMTGYNSNLPQSNYGGQYDWRNAVYGVMEDIDPKAATGNSTFRWAIRGEAPCRAFVNSYYEIPLFGNNDLKQSYQIVLYEGSNIIDVYVFRRNRAKWNDGRGVIGVQNKNGTKATCAPGRNLLDRWTTYDMNGKNKPEAWRFTPIIEQNDYSITWTNVKGDKLGIGDSLTVDCKTFVRDKIIGTLKVNACNGVSYEFRDTVILGFEKTEVISEDSICQTDKYVKNGWKISQQNVAGKFEYFRQVNENSTDFCGCDTIYTLKLTVNKRPNIDTTVMACAGDTVWLNNKFSVTDGYLLDTLHTIKGCDSIIVMRVKRYPNAKSVLKSIPQICADDKSFQLTFAKADSANIVPSAYYIDFDEHAEKAGFVDVDSTEFNSNYAIDVQMPDKVYPDKYCAKIVFTDTLYSCNPSEVPLCFDVLYPDTILQQKWDDAILVKNKYYNGGFDISSIQWYQDINGVPTIMNGKSNSNLTEVKKGATYRVEVTRPDGSKMFSCPITIDDGKPQKPDIVVLGDEILIILNKGGKSTVNIWTIGGVLLKTKSHTVDRYNVPTPSEAGTYLLEVISDDGGRNVRPLVINRK